MGIENTEIQFVVSVFQESDETRIGQSTGGFTVKVGLIEVGRVFKVQSHDPAWREEARHHGRWLWEGYRRKGDPDHLDPSTALDVGDRSEPGRMAAIMALLSRHAYIGSFYVDCV